MRGLIHGAVIVVVLALPSIHPVSAAAQTANGASAAPGGGPTLPPEEIARLVAPIALYPDVLIAQILPAATFPTDVVMAARWLQAKPDMAKLDEQSWDASVKALCRYPTVLQKLDADLEWTNALGAAFLDQGDDVMDAIQEARKTAQERGVLQTTKEQTIVVEQEVVRIVPTQPNVVYVPQYSPQVIYIDDDDDDDVSVAGAATAAAVSFGAGMALGAWLDMDCGWHGHGVYYCKPGYWGGYAHRGAIAVGDDWVAGVGPRRAFAAGEDRGFYAGPRGAAVWGENGGAAWRRPAGVAPRPVYSGRYAGYGNRTQVNRSGNFSNNQINYNRNNVNIDRGDRTNIGGGSRGDSARGDRRPTGSDGTRRPGQPSAGRPTQLPAGGYNRPTERPSAFDTPSNRAQSNKSATRGQQSRDTVRRDAPTPRSSSRTPSAQPQRSSSRTPSAQPQRSSSRTPSAQPQRSTASSRNSSFGDRRSSPQVSKSSNRGSSSRSSGASRSGRSGGRSSGGRSGGGRGGRR